MEARKIAFENLDGVVVRTMAWPDAETDQLTVIRRKDSRRLELMTSLDELRKKKIAFETIGVVNRSDLERGAVTIAGVGRLAEITENSTLLKNEVLEKESHSVWRGSLGAVLVGAAVFMSILYNIPKENKGVEQELKQQVVQIIQRIPVKPQTVPQSVADTRTSAVRETVTPTNKTASIKRMGALAVFGSMKSGSQKGGVNLGAVNTTAGPGLGGTAGSGGSDLDLRQRFGCSSTWCWRQHARWRWLRNQRKRRRSGWLRPDFACWICWYGSDPTWS